KAPLRRSLFLRPDDILQQSLQQGRGGLLQRASCIGFRPKSENQKMRFLQLFCPFCGCPLFLLKSGQKEEARRFTPDETVDISLCSDDSHFVSACPLFVVPKVGSAGEKWADTPSHIVAYRRISSHIVANAI